MANWLRRLWTRNSSDEHAAGGAGTPTTGRAAAFEVESRISDSLVAAPGTPISAEVLEHAKAANGRGAKLVGADGGPAGCVNTALGLALTGERVTSFVGGMGLSTIASSIALAAKRLSPLVTHAWLDRHADEAGHADWHRLEGTGALLAMAATPEEAYDLGVAMRMAAETALCPGVLGVDGRHAHPASAPDWPRVLEALGRAGDEIRTPTPTQVDVFGRDRRRVPAWLDPVHPMAIGQPASPIDAGMIAAGRTALFGSDVDKIVRDSLAKAKEILGRPVGMVRRRFMDDADVVLVAQGFVVATAEEVAEELRSKLGWKVGVLGVTWISPFPASDLAADLGGRRAVFVIERTPPSPGDDPPLVRRVRAVVRNESVPVVSAVSAGASIEHENLKALCVANIERLGSKKGGGQHPSLDQSIRLDMFSPKKPSELPRRAAIEARVRANHPDLAALALSVPGGTSAGDSEGVAGREKTPAAHQDKQPPALLRRIGRSRIAPDSLPRVWGDVLEPRQRGPWPTLPDPIVGSAAVPALSAALLRDRGESLPSFLAKGCTGCGRCWTVCPDGAIGATAIGLAGLLDSASRTTGKEGQAADTVRRAHRHIAGRAVKLLDEDVLGVLPRAALRDAWIWAAGKLGIPETDLAAHDEAFEATLDKVESLKPLVTDAFFRALDGDAPATEALILAANPEACSACGLCAAECPEDVIELREMSAEEVDREALRWSDWETLEDTSGSTCKRAAASPDIGEMAARLLSRHTGQAVIGTGSSFGSGERLGLRLAAALTEYHGQVRAASLERELEIGRAAVDKLLRERMSTSLIEADTEAVAKALGGEGVRDVGDLARALDRLGTRGTIDREALLDLASLAERLGNHQKAILQGADGLGRSRYALALGGPSFAERIAPYPEHPFFAPLLVDTSIASGAMALGAAEGLAEGHLRLVRDIRRAEIEAESPPDRPGRVKELEKLRWSDLSPEERASCPPLLFVLDDAFLLEAGTGVITRLLSADLPVKVLLLDGLQPGRRPDPTLLAIAHQRAFVLSSSIAHPDHFASGLLEALTHPGPAFIQVHAPVPRLHGFQMNATMERARAAVAARAHLLFKYDPEAEGAFGLRLSLEEKVHQDAPSLALRDWAAGEERFGEAGADLPPGAQEACEERWLALSELAGRGGALEKRVEQSLREELSREYEAELSSRSADLDARIAEAAERAAAEARERLTDRLLHLSAVTAGQGNGSPETAAAAAPSASTSTGEEGS